MSENEPKNLLSIIVPFYNEEFNLPLIFEEILTLREKISSHFDIEVLFMDNHSSDTSFEVAYEFSKEYKWVRIVRLSRNFGYQANILAGYRQAQGDVIVQLDADGEDNPALIEEMLHLWKTGYDVVYGIRLTRQESSLMTFQRKIFYRALSFLSPIEIPQDAGDFRLFDRKVLGALRNFNEKNVYIRGLISYVGFKQVGLPYHRRPRWKGKSKFNWFSYFTLAADGILSFSKRPLHLINWIGLAISGCSFFGVLIYLVIYMLGKVSQQGFTTLVLLLLFLSGIQLLCLGMIATYLGRVYDEVKNRPLSIIERTVNIGESARLRVDDLETTSRR